MKMLRKLNSSENPFAILKPSAGNLFGTLLITFFVMLLVVGFIQIGLDHFIGINRTSFLIGSSLQSILAFILPSLLAAVLCIGRPFKYLGMTVPVYIRQFIGVIIIYLFVTPALNYIIDWNAAISLPDSMAAIEAQFRDWENSAAVTTGMILNVSTVGGLISGILIVGCLTGLAEEMFFRAGFQRALSKVGCNCHIAVWVTAFIFSTIHFQFFGFIPRLLIGAGLGYLYFYTGSIWIASFAHALNNSMTVFAAWLMTRGELTIEVDKIGTANADQLWLAVLSAVLTVAFIIFCGKKVFFNQSEIEINQ